MKKASEVFKSIRFAKGEPRDKPHKSTDEEGHYTVGEKEFNQQLQHLKKMAMQEEIKDKTDIGEYDQEGDMAKSDLRSIIANAQKLHDMIDDADNLPEWVQSKITKAEDYISTVANYMAAEMNEAVNRVDVPAYLRKQKGEKPLTVADVKAPRKDSISAKENLAKARNEEVEQIDEISKKTLGSYVNKAASSLSQASASSTHKRTKASADYDDNIRRGMKKKDADAHLNRGYDSAKPDIQRVLNRVQGIKRAASRLSKEEVEQIDEKNVPTSPEKWAQAKAQAKAKFDVYPSAYANGWAAKKYKEMGGGWKSVSEAKEDLPFEPDPKPNKPKVVPGKHGAGYSTARHLARMAMQKQSEKMKKPIKEEEMSKKAQIVKSVAKKKKESAESFQKDPIISKSEVKM